MGRRKKVHTQVGRETLGFIEREKIRKRMQEEIKDYTGTDISQSMLNAVCVTFEHSYQMRKLFSLFEPSPSNNGG